MIFLKSGVAHKSVSQSNCNYEIISSSFHEFLFFSLLLKNHI